METPNRTARSTRLSTAEPPRRHRFEAEPEPSRHESGVGPGVDNRSGPVTAPSPTPALRLRAPARNSTLLFRALLLVAAAVFIGIDGFRAFFSYLGKAEPSARAAAAKG